MQAHIKLPMRSEWRITPGRPITESQFVALCRANPGLRVERSAKGELIVMPPAGGEGSYRSGNTFAQLERWADRNGSGRAFDCSIGFRLPDTSTLSPDASWVSNESLSRLTSEQRREFLRLCPEFVIEVMSPSDRLNDAKAKMQQWIDNGAQLAWLIDGDHQTVYVYRPGKAVLTRKGIKQLSGEGPVAGFVLKLERIWRGLN